MKISWEDSTSYFLFNPTYPKEEQAFLHSLLDQTGDWKGHVWLSTSGSLSQKWVGLSKEALLASAQAVNVHLRSNSQDRWVNALPLFHVGGLGVYARSYLSGAQVFDFKSIHPGKWQAVEYYLFLQETKATLASLVPAQLHDLVVLGLEAPPPLRALVIGGGALLPYLYEKAIQLKWPVLPSYGLTECASQVATAALESWRSKEPSLQLLSHCQAKVSQGRLCLSGPSLLSTYLYIDHISKEIQFRDPKIEGWLMTEDLGKVDQGHLTVFGRGDAIVKIGGENVDLARLEEHLQTLRIKHFQEIEEVTLIAMRDERLGYTIHLAAKQDVNPRSLDSLTQQFQQTVLPFERIRKVYLVSHFPRSPLGKILKKELLSLINSGNRPLA